MKSIAHTIASALAAGLVAIGLTACMSAGAQSTNAGPGQLSTCATPPAVTATTRTIAIEAQSGPGVNYYTPDLNDVTTAAQNLKAEVLVNGVGSNNAARSLVSNQILTGDGINKIERTDNLNCKLKAVTTAVTSTLARNAASKPFDVFDSLLALQGNLTGSPSKEPVDVVLLTSLLNTAAPVNLGDPKVLGNPIAAINTLAAQRLLPDCKNWRVYAVGGDHTTPALNDADSALLRQFWLDYFDRCGGTLVTWTDHLTQFPIGTGSIQTADTGQIQVQPAAKVVAATLNGDVLFDPGSPALRRAADGQLTQLLELAARYSGPIVITGYTDVGGNENANHHLSVGRANGVKAWLVARGVSKTRVSAGGDGSQHPVYANPTTDAQHQTNRRVVATISTS